jgi:ribonuclease Z
MTRGIFKLRNALVATLAIVLIFFLFQKKIQHLVIEKLIEKRLSENTLASLPDGLHIGLCGSGSPFPDLERNESCTLIIAGHEIYLIDVGDNSSRNIWRMHFNTSDVHHILLTHYHSDHFDGIGQLMTQRWASSGSVEPISVHGPKGLETIVNGINQAYSLDRIYRHTHHGEATIHDSGFGLAAHPFDIPQNQDSLEIIHTPDLIITAILVDHSPVEPAVGYLIRYKGRSVLVSGDTKPSPVVTKYAQGVDVLVHEALSEELMLMLKAGAQKVQRDRMGKIFSDVTTYHTTPEQGANIAKEANVKFLLYSHVAPALAAPGAEGIFLGNARKIFSGNLRVGKDGDFISLPIGSSDIQVKNLF